GLMVSETAGRWRSGVEAVMLKHRPYVAGRLLSVSCSSARYCTAVGGFEQVKGALFNSSPTPPCLVPTLKGRPVRVAKEAIRAYDCSVGKVTRATSQSVNRGRVISQRPRAGTRLDRGGKVSLVVSNGKAR
ncbi:MAG TPA: PASTA domain-containing protein, partial [Gaiellaceae bacterium]